MVRQTPCGVGLGISNGEGLEALRPLGVITSGNKCDVNEDYDDVDDDAQKKTLKERMWFIRSVLRSRC